MRVIPEHSAPPRWNVISEPDFLDALRRCAAGEDPDLVYIEFYVNADVEQIGGNE